MNAFETLGLRWDADQAQVHAAYRSRVKGCHPDQFQDQAQADQAQEQLIRLTWPTRKRCASPPSGKLALTSYPVRMQKRWRAS